MQKRVFSVLLLMALISIFVVPVQAGPPENPGGPEVSPAVQADVSAPLRDAPVSAPSAANMREQPLRLIPPAGPMTGVDGAVQTTTGPLVSTAGGLSFPGVGQGDYGFSDRYAPPDTNGAVGATQYVQWVNVNLAVFDKASGAIAPVVLSKTAKLTFTHCTYWVAPTAPFVSGGA